MNSLRAQILKELEHAFYGLHDHLISGQGWEEREAWFSRALDRYALAVVEASVPEERSLPFSSEEVDRDVHESAEYARDAISAHNLCRAETLSNARNLTQVVPPTNL